MGVFKIIYRAPPLNPLQGVIVKVLIRFRANDVMRTHCLMAFQTLVEPTVLRLPIIGCNFRAVYV